MILRRENPKSLNWVRLTKEHDEEILLLIDEHGKNWFKIAEIMKIDNPLKIKNRYYNSILKRKEE